MAAVEEKIASSTAAAAIEKGRSRRRNSHSSSTAAAAFVAEAVVLCRNRSVFIRPVDLLTYKERQIWIKYKQNKINLKLTWLNKIVRKQHAKEFLSETFLFGRPVPNHRFGWILDQNFCKLVVINLAVLLSGSVQFWHQKLVKRGVSSSKALKFQFSTTRWR